MKNSLKSSIFILALSLMACALNPDGSFKAPSTGVSNPYTSEATLDTDSSDEPPGGGATPAVTSRANVLLYDLIPDSITTLTCPFDQIVAGRTYALSVGSYSQGLKLSEEFKEQHNITLDTEPQKTRTFIESSNFLKAQAFLSLRDESDLRIVKQSLGKAIKTPFPLFHNETTLEQLSIYHKAFGARTSSNTSVANSSNFRVSLPLSSPNLRNLIPGLHPDNQGTDLLTLTYSSNNQNQLISNTKNQPYGRGYKMTFEDSYKANYLTNVYEENLLTTQLEGRWECPEYLRFMVHWSNTAENSDFNTNREKYKDSVPEDTLNEGYCHPRSPTAQEKTFFELEFGPQKNWPFEVGTTMVFEKNGDTQKILNTGKPCIQFLQRGCYYKLVNKFYRFEFNPHKQDACVSFDQFQNDTDRYKICPAFLSACFRR